MIVQSSEENLSGEAVPHEPNVTLTIAIKMVGL
jgi:hypothetical protein